MQFSARMFSPLPLTALILSATSAQGRIGAFRRTVLDLSNVSTVADVSTDTSDPRLLVSICSQSCVWNDQCHGFSFVEGESSCRLFGDEFVLCKDIIALTPIPLLCIGPSNQQGA